MSKPKINPWSIVLVIVMMVGGLVVYYNYVQELKRQSGIGRPAYYAALETNLQGIEASGETVSLNELKGKVYLCNYIFTRCPGQCIGVAEVMKKHLADYSGHPLFHMVSVSLDPAHDTAADMEAFAKKNELESKQWWFMTGEESEIRPYMRRYFKFFVREKPEAARTTEFDLYDHEGLIALVDHKARIRGVYSVFDGLRGEEYQARLKEDLEKVMQEAMEETPMDSLPEEKGFSKDWPVKEDIELQRQDGMALKFSEMKGKVVLLSHVFTRCPRQCPGICAMVNEVRGEFADNPAFMVASLTMDPGYDTPEVLSKFATTHEYVFDDWWFLTGDEENLPKFMAEQLLFAQQVMPEDQRQVPTDLYDHDSRLALMDHEMKIRGWYDALAEEDLAKLRKDLKVALAAVSGG